MDAEAIRRKRMEDIEIKRKRLEEMRKSRPSIDSTAIKNNQTSVSFTTPAPSQKTFEESQAETDDLISSLLAPAAMGNTTNTSIDVAVKKSAPKEDTMKEKIKSFSKVKCTTVISILPTRPVTYEKSSQTEDDDKLFSADNRNDDKYEEEKNIDAPDNSYSSPFKRDPIKSASFSYSTTSADSEWEDTVPAEVKLTEAECSKIMADQTFIQFLKTSSLYVERALNFSEDHDIFRDYTTEDKDNAPISGTGVGSNNLNDHSSFQRATAFETESLLGGRPVMDLKWSPLVPELFLAAYGSKAVGSVNKQQISSATTMTTINNNSNSEHSHYDAPGVVCVWSKDMHTRPEFKFLSSSPVLTAVFHSQEQHLVLGGCYSGQILMWDMRMTSSSGSSISNSIYNNNNSSPVTSSLPLQRSSMSGRGHKHPVYAMAMTNTASAYSVSSAELVSVSTDGVLCHWDVSRLTEPLSVVQLHLPSINNNLYMNSNTMMMMSQVHYNAQGNYSLSNLGDKINSNNINSPLNICAMAFGHTDSRNSMWTAGGNCTSTDSIIFGSGSGQVIRSQLPHKAGNNTVAKIDAHLGLVTSIQPHPSRSSKYKHLLLTSSLDWTVKLWDTKQFATSAAPFNTTIDSQPNHHQQQQLPIMEFFSPSYDYVCDVQWSPVHPAVFVTITSGGKLLLWNLGKSCTEPIETISIILEHEDDNNNANTTTGTAAASTSTNLSNISSSAINNLKTSGNNSVTSATTSATSHAHTSNNVNIKPIGLVRHGTAVTLTALAGNTTSNASSGSSSISGSSTTTSNYLSQHSHVVNAPRALNKVVWSRDGLTLLVGDSQGTLHYIKVHATTALPSAADEGRFEMAIVSSRYTSDGFASSNNSNNNSNTASALPTAVTKYDELSSNSNEGGSISNNNSTSSVANNNNSVSKRAVLSRSTGIGKNSNNITENADNSSNLQDTQI